VVAGDDSEASFDLQDSCIEGLRPEASLGLRGVSVMPGAVIFLSGQLVQNRS